MDPAGHKNTQDQERSGKEIIMKVKEMSNLVYKLEKIYAQDRRLLTSEEAESIKNAMHAVNRLVLLAIEKEEGEEKEI